MNLQAGYEFRSGKVQGSSILLLGFNYKIG